LRLWRFPKVNRMHIVRHRDTEATENREEFGLRNAGIILSLPAPCAFCAVFTEPPGPYYTLRMTVPFVKRKMEKIGLVIRHWSLVSSQKSEGRSPQSAALRHCRLAARANPKPKIRNPKSRRPLVRCPSMQPKPQGGGLRE